MNKVIVSGATSMLGLALIGKCIENNVRVTALVRKNSEHIKRLPKSDLINVVDCDLNQIATLDLDEGYDVFYHFGWANTQKGGRNIPEMQNENIRFTLDAIHLAKRTGCKKFVGAGSQAEYGRHTEEKTGPDTPVDPQTAYGVAKYAAGKLGAIEASRLGLSFIWVRIFSVYGEYDTSLSLISTTIDKLRKGEHCSFTKAEHQWDFLYSADAGNAFYLIGKKSEGNKVYCLGSGESKPLKDYIYIIRDKIAPGVELGIGEIPSDNSNTQGMCADINELKKDIGFSPVVSFIHGLENIINKG